MAVIRLLAHVQEEGLPLGARRWEDLAKERAEAEATDEAPEPTPGRPVSRKTHDASCTWRVSTPQTNVIASHCAGCGRLIAMDPTAWLEYHGRSRLPKGMRARARALAGGALALRRHLAGERTPPTGEGR